MKEGPGAGVIRSRKQTWGQQRGQSCRSETGAPPGLRPTTLCSTGHPRERPRATGGSEGSRGNGEGRAGTFSCYSSWTLLFLQLYWDIIGRQLCKPKVYYVTTWYMRILQNDCHDKAGEDLPPHMVTMVLCVVRTSKIYSLSDCATYNTALFSVVPMLYVTSPKLTHNWSVDLWPPSPHFSHPTSLLLAISSVLSIYLSEIRQHLSFSVCFMSLSKMPSMPLSVLSPMAGFPLCTVTNIHILPFLYALVCP